MKNIYNRTTKELFNYISFISPLSIFKNINIDIRIKRINYCYFFPQRNYTWHQDSCAQSGINYIMYKASTTYWWLIWKVDIIRVRDNNLRKIKNKFGN